MYAMSLVFILALLSVEESLSCVVSPSDRVAIAGEQVSFNCNARPNNKRQGTVLKWTLGHEGTSGTLIYQPPVYGPNGKLNVEQKVANGYFLSHADEDLINVTILINKTQLRHGGKYFCTCAGYNSSMGTLNLAVLDPEPTFVQNEANSKETIDLNCSMSFNGSTPSASVDLTILNATGAVLANRSNLQLVQNVASHHVTYRVIADSKDVQNFTCDMKVWEQSSNGKNMMHHAFSSLGLNPGTRSALSSASAGTTLGAIIGAIVVISLRLS